MRNRTRVAVLNRLLTHARYEVLPTAKIDDDTHVHGLHVFTFNQVAETETWRNNQLARLQRYASDPPRDGPVPTKPAWASEGTDPQTRAQIFPERSDR